MEGGKIVPTARGSTNATGRRRCLGGLRFDKYVLANLRNVYLRPLQQHRLRRGYGLARVILYAIYTEYTDRASE